MVKKGLLALAVLALAMTLVIGAVGCGSDDETSTPAVKVGAVVCLTGALAGMGPDIRDGFQLAANEINASGGIDGAQIELIVEDSATESTLGLEAVKKLVEINGVKVILGPMISGSTLASGPYAEKREVLLISPSATSPDIADQSWRKFVYRTAPTDSMQGSAVAQLVRDGGYEKVGLFIMDNQYGVGVENVVKELLADDVEFVSAMRYDPVKLDYLTELQLLKDSGPDVVVHVGYGDDGQVVYKQALELGLDTIQWVTIEGVYAPATLEMAEAAEFMAKAVIGTRAIAAGEGYDIFSAAFEAEFGHAPSVYAEYAYDAMMMAALAMRDAGTEDAAAIADALMLVGQDYEGASGTITFSEFGDRMGGVYEVWKVVETDEGHAFERVKIVSL